MKTSAKSIVGVALSVAWLLSYAGGGAYLLAHKAMENTGHVAAYMPLVIFLWVAGFFIGHAALERACSLFIRSEEFVEFLPFNPTESEKIRPNIEVSYDNKGAIPTL